MTEIGSDLTVDGTIAAKQASKAGEAVVLGSDGLIPADLLPKTSGGGIPYFYTSDTRVLVTGLSSAQSSYPTKKRTSIVSACVFGTNYNSRDSTVPMFEAIILPGIGPVAANLSYLKDSTEFEEKHSYQLTKSQIEAVFNGAIRTNLRGQFIINGYIGLAGGINDTLQYDPYTMIKINISDTGINVIGTPSVELYHTSSMSSGWIGCNISSITCDLPAWS